MFKQVFKIIWKNKGKNKLLMFEFLISFILIFVITTAIVWAYSASQQKLGYKYKDVFSIELISENKKDSEQKTAEETIEYIRNISGVEDASMQIYSHPFTKSIVSPQSFYYKDESFKVPRMAGIAKDWHKVFRPKFVEGRPMTDADISSEFCPCYLTQNIKQRVFGKNSAVGELIEVKHMGKFKVIGVIESFKSHGELSDDLEFFLCFRGTQGKYPYSSNSFSMRGSFTTNYKLFYVRSNSSNKLEFKSKLFKNLVAGFPGNRIEINELSKVRESNRKSILIPFVAIAILFFFLIINILLGMFGQLWYTVNLRKQEIGIRVAVGASKIKIYIQLLGEMWIMCLLAIIPALILLSQLPVLDFLDIKSSIYVVSLLLTTLVIFLLVSISSYLPARQATRFEVASALHEN
jgi:putative ABC transport system permease protein